MTTIAVLLQTAEEALARRDFQKAHALCLQALEAEPRCGGAYFLLGLLTAEHANFAKAIELFERSISFDPVNSKPRAHRARALLALNRHDEARHGADLAAAGNPKDALTLDTIGVVYSRTGQHEIAIGFFERAIKAGSRSANIHFNLGAAQQFLGRFEPAARSYREAARIDPGMAKAHAALAHLKKQTPTDNRLEALLALFQTTADPDQRLHIGHALSKTYEDFGQPLEAFDWLIKAKQAKRATLKYSPRDDAAYFAAARQTALPAAAPGLKGNAPIFIAGLPRTGTTLAERVLSSHPDVTSAGELTAFSLLVKRMTGTPSPLVLDGETLLAARDLDVHGLGAAYMDFVRARIGGAARFIDKMPLNFFYAALILKALPNSRIVCLRRHPLDSCLSNFRQLFATGFTYYNYAFSLEDTARYYVQFHDLMEFWRAHLPAGRFTEVAYEDLVRDIEGETRRLLAFADLEFDPRCLAFHENAAPVATASSVQVRQPLYASSVGRWRAYGGRLSGAAKILFDGGALSRADFEEACRSS